MCDFEWSLLLRALRRANSRPASAAPLCGTGHSSPKPSTLAPGFWTRANNCNSMPYLGIATEVGSVQLILEAGIASRRPFAAKANFVPFKKSSLKPLRGDAIDETTPGATDSSGHDSPAASPSAQLPS